MKYVKYYLLLIFLFTYYLLSAQHVSTVGGVLETPGFNDGAALSARFFNPHGIAIDEVGNVYIADRYNHTIRKLGIDGMVSTLAGKAGFSGTTDGVGEEARFNEPWGICAAPDGTLFIADTKNNKIRQLSLDGRVTTIAGTGNFGSSDGFGLTTTFGNPTGIERDSVGNIYIAEHLTHTIRKIDTKGFVSTIAGIPYIPGDSDGQGREAQFWRPYGLTIDQEGNILVADEWNHKIRKVTPEGVVTTIAGIGEVDLINGDAQTAAFNYPWDVTVDEANNIYIVDGYNYVVRKITPEGQVSTYAGTPLTSGGVDGLAAIATFSGATSIAYDEITGSLYVGDAYNHLIRTITTDRPITLSLINITGKEELCEGETLSLTGRPTTASNYAFYVDGNLIQNGETPTISLNTLTAGTHEIQVASYDGEDLLESNIISVEVIGGEQPSISVVGELTFYEGDSVILVANGVGDFLWSNQESTQTITVKEAGQYSVVLNPINGKCGSRSDIVEVTVLSDLVAPIISIEGATAICPGTSTLLLSDYPTGNQWLKDGWLLDNSTDNTLEVTEPGFYQVQISDPITGVFVFSEAVEIQAIELGAIDFTVSNREPQLAETVQFEMQGAAASTYYWDFGVARTSEAAMPSHQYTEPGIYSVSLAVENDLGCRDTIFKENYIQVLLETGLFIPSAFTPNGDGINDLFLVRGQQLDNYNLQIYNQWGGLLHVSQNQEDGWTGYKDGQPVNCGTYTYMISWKSPKEGTQYTSGHITLLR